LEQTIAAPWMINQKQYRRLLREFARTNNMSFSALSAGVDRKTARKYLRKQQSLEEQRRPRAWRTRPDPLASLWPEAERRLRAAPEIEAKALFEHLRCFHAEDVGEGALRTFQRRVALWRREHGPQPEVIFAQVHRPGELLQIDWTRADELEVSIQGRPLAHLLCQAVLPYSNWQWATRCSSESFLSLRHGLQEALFRLGRVPGRLQIDNSTTATHDLRRDGQRGFNDEFLALVGHFGLSPQTIAVGCPNQNGDVESQQGHLKRRLIQHLLLRGNRDFESEEAYDLFLEGVLNKANASRAGKVSQELELMRPLPPVRLCEYAEVDCRVCCHSTVRVRGAAYSVPARYIGQRLRARVFEGRVEIYHVADLVVEAPRSVGRRPKIDYRHVIDSLLRKPGAFARYRYREELFPSLTFRRALDRLIEHHGARDGELEYLRLLKLTAEIGPAGLESLLSEHLADNSPPWRASNLRNYLFPKGRVSFASLEAPVDLGAYDRLLQGSEVSHAG
jgi:transposase InsO family protein